MRILILGGDGYLGWPTAMHFSLRGGQVAVLDNFSKRMWELEEGVKPLVSVPTLHKRVKRWYQVTNKKIELFVGDLCNHRFIYNVIKEFSPDVVIHYGEQPSAPYSMQSRDKAVYTQYNNVVGNLNLMFAIRKFCPDVHLIKLGTMGEYGTPNIDIEEGWLEVNHNGRMDKVLYPKKPHSFYHLSKVHDSHNIEFACRVWGMRATDLNQGCVYGIKTNETDLDPLFNTSFHYDDIFGTVLNRFLVQAATGEPLTVYGGGTQIRGFLNIRDTIKCVEISVDNPAERGDFRVFNQFTEQFSIMQLAKKVISVAHSLGIDSSISHLKNPRVEQEEHYYNAKHSKLENLGLDPNLLTEKELKEMFLLVKKNTQDVDTDFFLPRVKWTQ
jgi:UDP-sulfoquinovose synthase